MDNVVGSPAAPTTGGHDYTPAYTSAQYVSRHHHHPQPTPPPPPPQQPVPVARQQQQQQQQQPQQQQYLHQTTTPPLRPTQQQQQHVHTPYPIQPAPTPRFSTQAPPPLSARPRVDLDLGGSFAPGHILSDLPPPYSPTANNRPPSMHPQPNPTPRLSAMALPRTSMQGSPSSPIYRPVNSGSNGSLVGISQEPNGDYGRLNGRPGPGQQHQGPPGSGAGGPMYYPRGQPGPGQGPPHPNGRPMAPHSGPMNNNGPLVNSNRASTLSMSGWEDTFMGSAYPGQHPPTRPPPMAPGLDTNGLPGGHRRAASTQVQPTYYGGEANSVDRSPSLTGYDHYAGPLFPPHHQQQPRPPGAYSAGYQPQQQQQQLSGPGPNRQSQMAPPRQFNDGPGMGQKPPPRSQSQPQPQPQPRPGGDPYYYPAPLRKMSLSENGMDISRISLDSTASHDTLYNPRQQQQGSAQQILHQQHLHQQQQQQSPIHQTPPNRFPTSPIYSRGTMDSDLTLDGYPTTRQRSASKSSVNTNHSAHSINDYYPDFDSSAVRPSTPNGTSTPQISIQSAQGFSGRADPFSMRVRTPSPGRTRQGSNPLVHRAAAPNPPVFLNTGSNQAEATRRSAESVRVPPPQNRMSKIQGERSQSFSSYSNPGFNPQGHQQGAGGGLPQQQQQQLIMHQQGHSIQQQQQQAIPSNALVQANRPPPKKLPIVYPALLSRVANAFVQRITTSSRIKDSIEYKDCFDGRDAVDKIAFIIKTTDRNLALLLGRALDAQKLFHDVTYDHRLRDSVNELYQFRNKMITGNGIQHSPAYNNSSHVREDLDVVNGVFTLLTDCYSPTCTRDRLCYSIACPRRLEQQSRLNMAPNGGLKRALTRSASKEKKDQRLWITSVPKSVSDKLPIDEKRRQEVIFELVYTEKDFVNDLKYLNDCWITPIRKLDIIEESRRETFINQVFYNINDVYAVNSRLGDALIKRQQEHDVVHEIGDIFLRHVPNFAPFVQYGANQIQAKYVFETEKNRNPAFAKFVEETERAPQSRKLELNGYLTKPTTRLGRYPLLLEAVLKYTPDDHPDKKAIPQAIEIIKDFLGKVNLESGKCENRFNLRQINERLIWKGEPMNLNLLAENRQMIMKGPLKKKGTSSEQADLYVFVFDHVLLLTKEKKWKGGENYKVHKRPIPLELLSLSTTEEPMSKSTKRTSSLIPYKGPSHASNVVAKMTPSSTTLSKSGDSKSGYPIVFHHIGRDSGSFTLYATTQAGRKNWMDRIQKQIHSLQQKADSWKLLPVSEKFFTTPNRVTCSATFDNGRRIVIGTDTGVYVNRGRRFILAMPLERVSQVDVLEDEGIFLVLSDKQLFAYGLEALESTDSNAVNKRSRRLGSHVSFFKTGNCQNQTFLGIVKNSSNALDQSSTIKTLVPIDQTENKKNKPSLRNMLLGGNNSEFFKVYKVFYIPREVNSLHFLRNTICVGCSKGFELVDLGTLKTQDLLDFTDTTLDFVQKRGETLKPIAIYRIGAGDTFMFLLCYDDFAFYVDKTGRRARPNWLINWEGVPTFCALSLPYIIAFDPNFIEIRDVESGDLVQIIPGNGIRCLHHIPNVVGAIHVVMTDDEGTHLTVSRLCQESQISQLLLDDDAGRLGSSNGLGGGSGSSSMTNLNMVNFSRPSLGNRNDTVESNIQQLRQVHHHDYDRDDDEDGTSTIVGSTYDLGHNGSSTSLFHQGTILEESSPSPSPTSAGPTHSSPLSSSSSYSPSMRSNTNASTIRESVGSVTSSNVSSPSSSLSASQQHRGLSGGDSLSSLGSSLSMQQIQYQQQQHQQQQSSPRQLQLHQHQAQHHHDQDDEDEDELEHERERRQHEQRQQQTRDGSNAHPPSSSSPSSNFGLKRLSLDLGDGFFEESLTPDSPQSFQEILEIGPGGVLGHQGHQHDEDDD